MFQNRLLARKPWLFFDVLFLKSCVPMPEIPYSIRFSVRLGRQIKTPIWYPYERLYLNDHTGSDPDVSGAASGRVTENGRNDVGCRAKEIAWK